jgi:hypothetical protein
MKADLCASFELDTMICSTCTEVYAAEFASEKERLSRIGNRALMDSILDIKH